jgi:hypothetical protein
VGHPRSGLNQAAGVFCGEGSGGNGGLAAAHKNAPTRTVSVGAREVVMKPAQGRNEERALIYTTELTESLFQPQEFFFIPP